MGFAFGTTGALLYLGCALLMLSMGHDGTVTYFNTLLHGIDISSIIRMKISLVEAVLGLVQTFILCWIIGACIAGIYNATLKSKINSIR